MFEFWTLRLLSDSTEINLDYLVLTLFKDVIHPFGKKQGIQHIGIKKTTITFKKHDKYMYFNVKGNVLQVQMMRVRIVIAVSHPVDLTAERQVNPP